MSKKHNVLKDLNNIPQASNVKIDTTKILKTLNKENENNSFDKKIIVSFRFLDRNNKLFNLGNANIPWMMELLDTLKFLTEITKNQLFNEYRKKFQPHQYNEVEKLKYKDEFLTNPQYEECYQLRLTKSTGRIHGFFVNEIYYIRFLDKEHNMYEDKRYGGPKYYLTPQTPYEMLQERNNELEVINQILIEKSNKNYNIICDNCLECPNSISDKFEV